MTDMLRWCSSCDAETFFETVVPDDGCIEGELGCVDCGDAIVVGVFVTPLAAGGAVAA